MGITVYDQARPLENEEDRVRAIADLGLLNITDDALLQTLVDQARELFGAAMAAVTVPHEDWVYVVVASGILTGPYSRRTSFCGHCLHHPEPVFCVPDAAADERFAGNPLVFDSGMVGFYAGAVLFDERGVRLGALCVFDPRARSGIDAGSLARLRDLADRATHRLRERRPAAARHPTGPDASR